MHFRNIFLLNGLNGTPYNQWWWTLGVQQMRGRSATVHAINHMIVKAILSLRFCNHQNEYKSGNFTLSYLSINDVLFDHWTETIIYGDWYTPTLDFRLPLFTLVIFFKCIEYKYIKYKCVQKITIIFCIAIKFLYVENMEGKREQMKFAHVKVIYTLCVSKIIFFLQFAKHKLRNDTVCYTPLLAARGILTLQATEF